MCGIASMASLPKKIPNVASSTSTPPAPARSRSTSSTRRTAAPTRPAA